MSIFELFRKQKHNHPKETYVSKSDKLLQEGLHISKIQPYQEVIYTKYNIGDSDDITSLRNLARLKGIQKIYNCDICGSEKLESVIISDTQNQFKLNENSASSTYNSVFPITQSKLLVKRNYRLIGTDERIFENHLILAPENHKPLYSIFLDIHLFRDIMDVLKRETDRIPNLKAFFNSDTKYNHFHVHLSDQKIKIIDDILFQSPSVKSNYFTENVRVYFNENIETLFDQIARDWYGFIRYINTDTLNGKLLEDKFITATYQYKSGRYWACVQFCNKSKRTFSIPHRGEQYEVSIFAPAFLCLFRENINESMIETITSIRKISLIKSKLKELYISPNDNVYKSLMRINIRNDLTTIHSTDLTKLINSQFLKEINTETLSLLIPIEPHIRNKTFSKLFFNSLKKCIDREIDTTNPSTPCSLNLIHLYTYVASYIINNISDLFTNVEIKDLLDLKITMQKYHIFQYNSPSHPVSTNYLYFKGEFLQKLIKKTFHNLLLASNGGNTLLQKNQNRLISEWLTYTYKQIGEASSFGTVTESKIKIDGIILDMIIKIGLQDEPDTQFYNEFFSGLNANIIRDKVPNYIITYGAFFCNSSLVDDTKRLCDGYGYNYNYLLIENVKGSVTFSRKIKNLPINNRSTDAEIEIEVENIRDGIYQIITALSFGWEENRFTHYDLHTDNILEYDFINGSNGANFQELFIDHHQLDSTKINKFFFRYYHKDGTITLVPSKNLYVFIDYGRTYTDNRQDENGAQYKIDRSVYKDSFEDIGSSTNKPNSFRDIYQFSMELFCNIFTFHPVLLINLKSKVLRDNFLNHYFRTFFYDFKNIFVDSIVYNSKTYIFDKKQSFDFYYASIFQYVYDVSKTSRSINSDIRLWLSSIIQVTYRLINFPWIILTDSGDFPIFNENIIGKIFKNSSDVRNNITDYYKNRSLIDETGECYYFNWGYVPNGVERGIEPKSFIKDYIKNKQDDTKINGIKNDVVRLEL